MYGSPAAVEVGERRKARSWRWDGEWIRRREKSDVGDFGVATRSSFLTTLSSSFSPRDHSSSFDHATPLPNISEARPPHVLLYSPFWMDTIFKPRARAEELLSPEREAGNLTPRDYDATIEFLSNYHRQYPVRFSFSLFCRCSCSKYFPGNIFRNWFCPFPSVSKSQIGSLQACFNWLRLGFWWLYLWKNCIPCVAFRLYELLRKNLMGSIKPWKIYKHKLVPLRTACSCNAFMNYHQMTWTLIRFKRIVGYSSKSSANLTSHILYSVPQLTLPKASDNNSPPRPSGHCPSH